MAIDGGNLYSRLGLSPDCSQAEIKAEYRWLARKFHPDHNPDDQRAVKKFREITEAYEILSDPAKRSAYDRTLGVSNPAEPPQPPRQSSSTPKPPSQPKPKSTPPKQTPRTVPAGMGKPEKFALTVTLIIVGLMFFGWLGSLGDAYESNQSSNSTQQLSTTPQNMDTSEFCDFVFNGDRYYDSAIEATAQRIRIADAMVNTVDLDSTVEIYAGRVIWALSEVAYGWNSSTQEEADRDFAQYQSVESQLATACGFQLQ